MEPAQKPSEEKSELPSNNFNKRKGSPGTPEYLYETIVPRDKNFQNFKLINRGK